MNDMENRGKPLDSDSPSVVDDNPKLEWYKMPTLWGLRCSLL